MGDSGEVHYEENKLPLDMKQKRTVKTPAQRHALEHFYQEHKFPSDEMKAQLAERVGLTEKQISSWFCHRRLKDKRTNGAHANGWQDHSSGVIQDRASGLRQDSCGSIKQGDHRSVDLKEVESRGINGRDLRAANLTHVKGDNQNPDVIVNEMDDISSESGSALQDRVTSHSIDPFEKQTSTYMTHSGAMVPRNIVGARYMGYKPSGYLKIKGETENPAITAVKRQLGRHYREDGPPLGIEFDPLPPGAFESLSTSPFNVLTGQNHIRDPSQFHTLGTSEVLEEPNLNARHKAHHSRMGSHDSYEGANRISVHLDRPARISCLTSKHDLSSLNSSYSLLGRDSYLKDDSARKIYASDVNLISTMNSKRAVKETRPDSFPNRPSYFDAKSSNRKAIPWFHDDKDVAAKFTQKSEILTRPLSLVSEFRQSLDIEEKKRPSAIMAKGEKRIRQKIEHRDPVKVANRAKIGFGQEYHRDNAASTKLLLLANQIGNFSEDKTAEMTSSID